MLKIIYLAALYDEYIREIIDKANNVKADTVKVVLQQSGGQPFLAQYIMHYAWGDLQNGTIPLITNIVNRFRSERYGDLAQWRNDIGESGLIAYKVLLEANNWLTEPEVKQQVNDEQIMPTIGPALINLCYHGLVVHDGTWSKYHITGELFKDWFTDDILPSLRSSMTSSPNYSPDTPSDCKDPILVISLYTNIFPTAYCHAITVERFPLVQCMIDNTGPYCANAKITVEATIQGFSEPFTKTLDIASGPGPVEQMILLPKLRPDAILKLSETYEATCRVVVRRHIESSSPTLDDNCYPLQLQAHSTALLALLDEDDKLKEDLTDYLAVFVTPRDAKIHELTGIAAAKYHPDKAIAGYQGAIIMVDEQPMIDLNTARKISRKHAKAFFDTLKHYAKLHYTNSTDNLGKQTGHFTQSIRLPFESLALPIGQSNCIDGAVVFASLLEHVGMEPFIVLVKGHSFVGWRIWEGVNQYDFLETTMIKQYNFQQALNEGNRNYNEACRRGDNTRPYLDPNGFMRLVDIADCRRKKHINPLPASFGLTTSL